MELIVKCKGKEYIAKNEYFLNCAIELKDTGTALNNPRLTFIISNFEYFEVKTKKQTNSNKINTVELLYGLSQEMNRCNLSSEDEDYLDEIIGNDPMCIF